MDLELIALDDRDSVARWCRRLGCSEADLIRAVWKVGPRPDDVDRFLGYAAGQGIGPEGGAEED